MADPIDEEILKSIKTLLGRPADPDPFDAEIILHINGVIATLNDLGVGPPEGLVIDADTKWSELLNISTKFENAKTYIYLRVRMIFDSSSMTQHQIASFERRITEEEWRLTVAADPLIPQQLPLAIDDEDYIFYGGTP